MAADGGAALRPARPGEALPAACRQGDGAVEMVGTRSLDGRAVGGGRAVAVDAIRRRRRVLRVAVRTQLARAEVGVVRLARLAREGAGDAVVAVGGRAAEACTRLPAVG